MGYIVKLYNWLEQHIFNSVTKKLVGNFTFLIFLHLIYIITFYIFSIKFRNVLETAKIDYEHLSEITKYLDTTFIIYICVISFGIISSIVIVYFLRHLILRPLKMLVKSFDTVSKGEGDLSEDLPCITYDEFRTLSISYNRFIHSIREMLASVRENGVVIAVESAKVLKNITETEKGTEKQNELSQLVFNASNEATQAINEVSVNANFISEST
ncbi:MAG: methyl-accepting chemotaxis protein, partial [Deferribacterales bacterium]|nr:methyl-accepting chemotaxis protein [Deferribacterales bacterium]